MVEFINALKIVYFDIISEFSIPLIIGIFAFVLPLLLHTAGRIDDKYTSTLLIKVFRKDWIVKVFLLTLIFALICCIVWCLQLPRCVDWGQNLNFIIDNSALLLLLVSTLLLVIFTIAITWLVYIYYLPEKLLERLEKQYPKSKKCCFKKKHTSMYFIAISKIMHYALRKSDKMLSQKTFDFFAKEFLAHRKKTPQPCTYPDEFYNFIIETNEIIFLLPRKKTTYFDESAIISLLMDNTSSRSFRVLWYTIRQALTFDNDKFIFAYWKRAHQYIYTTLNIKNDPFFDYKSSLANQSENKKEEIYRFLEFHYVLGGLLMMKEKYTLLNQIITWTNQEPPQYFLVPETMSEVIKRFMSIEKKDKEFLKSGNFFYYDSFYPFPDVSQNFANDIIMMWIKRYLSILFLRQYTIYDYFGISNPLVMPVPPQDTSEKQSWVKQLSDLKRYVNEYLKNHKILNSLEMEYLCETDWFHRNQKPTPSELIDEYVKQIEESINTDSNENLNSK